LWSVCADMATGNSQRRAAGIVYICVDPTCIFRAKVWRLCKSWHLPLPIGGGVRGSVHGFIGSMIGCSRVGRFLCCTTLRLVLRGVDCGVWGTVNWLASVVTQFCNKILVMSITKSFWSPQSRLLVPIPVETPADLNCNSRYRCYHIVHSYSWWW
jgi:hypothetical protein